MRYRAIIALMFTAAVGTLLVMYPGNLLRGSMNHVQQFSPMWIDNHLNDPDGADIIEMRERAHSAMLRLQLRREARN
jgi:hypothetical protein